MKSDVILLVEDSPDDIALTLRALRKGKIGEKVVVARDGVEALEYFFGSGPNRQQHRNELPQLVILDLKLPKIDGLEVLQRLRADTRTRLIPVVILTTSNEEQDIVRCYRHGANSYIRKPVNYSRFNEVMRQVGSYWLTLNEALPNGRAAS
jgi:two-component system response regulator